MNSFAFFSTNVSASNRVEAESKITSYLKVIFFLLLPGLILQTNKIYFNSFEIETFTQRIQKQTIHEIKDPYLLMYICCIDLYKSYFIDVIKRTATLLFEKV